MTLIALLSSATSFAQSEKDVDPSTPTPEQVVKARRQEAKLAKSLIEQKATKDAKKQAKLLKNKAGNQHRAHSRSRNNLLNSTSLSIPTMETFLSISLDALLHRAAVRLWHVSKL